MARLLCIDDNTELRKNLAEELRDANHVVYEAQNGREGLEVIRKYRPDLVLCDVDMPEMDGRALLREIRKDHAAFANMPFLFITGYSDREEIIHGKLLGADDYITKPVDFGIVLATVQSRLAQVERLEKLKSEALSERDKAVRTAHETISRISRHDPVTGLPNRPQLINRIETVLAGSGEGNKPAALFLLDLENFGAIRARYGNSAGDAVLKKVAERLSGFVAKKEAPLALGPETPLVASLGGAGFAILLSDIAKNADLSAYADKIQSAFSKPFRLDRKEIIVSAALGSAVYPRDGKNAADLQQAAAIALQFAKKNGTATWQPHAPAMNAEFQVNAELEQALQNAIKKDEFELHYQPQVDAETGKTISVEALIRWRRPKHGLIPPARFIPVVERTGLIIPLTEWVLETACLQVRDWRKAGLNGFKLAINLSPSHLREPDFMDKVTRIVAATGQDFRDIEFEIIESDIVSDGGAQLKTLQEISAAGITLAIDDFGTGYSSLAYLKRFPFDIIKIDRTFVRKIPTDLQDQTTVKAIIELARCHGLSVVAEGVETAEQLSMLRRLGCDRLQGYRISRPLPPSEFPKFVKQRSKKLKAA